MNKFILKGNLTQEPTVRQSTNGGSVTRFTVACNRINPREGQPTADYFRCVAFGKSADLIAQYFHTGAAILIEGRIAINSYKTQNGETAWSTDVIVERFEFCEKASSAHQQGQSGYAQGSPQNQQVNYQGQQDNYSAAPQNYGYAQATPQNQQNNAQAAPQNQQNNAQAAAPQGQHVSNFSALNPPTYTNPWQGTEEFTPYQPPVPGNAPAFNPEDVDSVAEEVPFH